MRQFIKNAYTRGRDLGEKGIELAFDHPVIATVGAGTGIAGGAAILNDGGGSSTPIIIEQDPIGYEVQAEVPALTAEDLKRQIDYYGKRIGTDQLTLMTLRDQYAQMGGQV